MAFEFGSDLIVDAMRAADPARVQSLRDKLQSFATAAATSKPDAKSGFQFELSAGKSVTPGKSKEAETLKKFEAVVLSTFVQSMLPKDAESVFGKGLAGDMWKAQMAEKLAEQIADRGGIGIADRLLKDYYKNGDEVVALSGAKDVHNAVADAKGADAAARLIQTQELKSLLTGDDVDSGPAIALPVSGVTR